jgi:cell division protein FtsW
MDNEKTKKLFLGSTFLIILIGILFVYSSSYIYAKDLTNSAYYFLSRHLLYLFLGLGVAYIVSNMKFNFWFKNSFWLNNIVTVLLLLTLIPGIGVATKGSHRWLNIGFTTIQPGEFVKYSIAFSSLYFFENYKSFNRNFIIKYLASLLAPLLLLILQPDFGTFTISLMAILFTCFMSDFPRKYFYSFLGFGITATALLLIAAPYRVKRLLVFLDPWADPLGSGFQIIQSYLAFANGGITGQGIGNSTEKLFYLPEAYNDFIFSVIGEEIGLLGVIFIVLSFSSFALFGFKLALLNKNRINAIIISLVTFIITLQAFLNMGVVLGLLPTKGLNLPFISYGGSSIVMNLVGIGIILSNLKEKSQVIQEEVKYKDSWIYQN